MVAFALQVALAPVLVGVSSLAARRWGERIGGTVSAFPAIAGPFLLLAAHQHGARFAASTANGTLAGLLALAGFIAAYARTARRGWRASLATGWLVAAALAAAIELTAPGPPLGFLIASGSLILAGLAIPEGGPARAPRVRGRAVPLSMALAAVLVLALSLAANAIGSRPGGVLAGLPVIATVLALEAHRRHGAAALYRLLRGMLTGMVAFVVFCETIAALTVQLGVGASFSIAALAALTTQSAAIHLTRRRAAARRFGQPPRAAAEPAP